MRRQPARASDFESSFSPEWPRSGHCSCCGGSKHDTTAAPKASRRLDRPACAARRAVLCRTDRATPDDASQSRHPVGTVSMSVQYKAIGWNRQKRIYDSALGGGVGLYLASFVGLGAWLYPTATT